MRVYMAQYILLLLLYLEAVRSGTNSNESSSGCELAYRNCSQKLRRFDGDNEFFNCVVGGKDELIKFNKTISQSKDSATLFDAPDLLGVSCFKNSEINPSLAIEVTFRLPRAIYPRVSDGNAGHYQFPKAIYLNLSEVREEAYSHPGFYKCHRERIFIFHKYFPRLNYDADNPRILSNRYMLGLQTSNHTNTYILSLTTAEGRSRDFYITLPVRDISSSNWRPVVATYLNVTQGTIQVIVEPQPRSFTSRGYNVTMCSEDRCSEPNTIDSRETNSTKFENITHGVYYVKVMSNTCAGAYTCPEVISYTVDALEIPKIADKFQPVPIAVIVAGSIVGVAVGVTVLIILTFCLRRGGSCAQTRRKSDKKPRGIVIHPFLDVSRSKSTSDRKYVKVMEDFQNFIVKAFDCELVPIPVGCLNCNKTALDKLFSGLDFVIVVCADNNSNPYFKTLLRRAVPQRKKKNNLLVVSVTLSCFPSPTKPECIADVDMIMLLQNIHTLSPVYNKIHTSNLKEDDSTHLIPFNTDSPEYQALKQSIKDASPLSHFENASSHIECDTETETKHICQTEQKIQLHSTKWGKDSHQHKPYEQDIEDNSPGRKRQEEASIKAKPSTVNDSSSDIFYNGEPADENRRELPLASIHFRRESNGYNQIRERQCQHHLDHTLYHRASRLDIGEHSRKLTVTHPPILNDIKEVHFKTFAVLHEHQIRCPPSDFANEQVVHASNLKDDESSQLMPCNIDPPEYHTLEQSMKDASRLSLFKNFSSQTECDTETETKHICQTERKIQLHLTKCGEDSDQHKPYKQDIEENSSEKKRQEVAHIKANLSRFNDSSSDIFYNGALAQENRRELPVASEQLRNESNGYIRNQGRERQCQQLEHHRASQFDSDETSRKMPI